MGNENPQMECAGESNFLASKSAQLNKQNKQDEKYSDFR